MKSTTEYGRLLQAVENALFKGQNIVDIDDLHELAGKQAVPLFVYDEPRVMARNICVQHAHREINDLLQKNAVSYTILKGCAASRYYPVPIRRNLGDVDFLVNESEITKVDCLLRESGYVLIGKSDHHWEYKKVNIVFELHWIVNGIPEGDVGTRTKQYLSNIVEESSFVSGMQMPSHFHHGIVLLLHMARHMTSSGMGLRHLCDWAMFVNSVENFAALFETCLRDIGLWEYAQLMTAVSYRIGLPRQDWVKEFPNDLIESTLSDILDAGNFGSNNSRAHEAWLVTNREATGLSKGNLIQRIIHKYNSVTKMNWPISKSIPLLLPIGWFVFGIKDVIRVLKSKKDIGKMFQSANDRRQLYSQFHLFEIESKG